MPLFDQLLRAVRLQTLESRFRLSDAAELELENEVRAAAQRLEQEDRTAKHDVEEAANAFRAWIDYAGGIERAAKRDYYIGSREIQPATLFEARAGLCPGFWPLC